jgi:hypothetical protein
MKLKLIAAICLSLLLAVVVSFGVRAAVGSPSPQPEGPEVIGRIMGPPIPQLEESEKIETLAIVQADPTIQEVMKGKPYTVSQYAVWHSGSGRKIGAGVRLTPEQPFWIEYDWPVLEFDEAKYEFPHYREKTIRYGLMVKDLYVRVDLLSGRMVAISPSE